LLRTKYPAYDKDFIFPFKERETEGALLLGDMGEGLPFRAGMFDGAISISALQWLCNRDKSYHKPGKRLYTFFSTLYACLSRYFNTSFQYKNLSYLIKIK